eukprot:18074-Eustigmatos_ZCMA.PRE.1
MRARAWSGRSWTTRPVACGPTISARRGSMRAGRQGGRSFRRVLRCATGSSRSMYTVHDVLHTLSRTMDPFVGRRWTVACSRQGS